MVTIKVCGKEFEILEKEVLQKIIDGLDKYTVFVPTFIEAYNYFATGKAYTYLDARTGTIRTTWEQQNTSNHPWDDYYRIILCVIETPVEIETIHWFGDDKEKQEYDKVSHIYTVEDYIREKYGEEEYNERLENIANYFADEFEFDYEYIQEQLNGLYEEV